MDYSPNVTRRIQDKSLGTVPAGTGSLAFITGSQWGEANKIITISTQQDLVSKLGQPVENVNQSSWWKISEYVEFYEGSAKVVRAIIDDSSSKNSSLMVNVDGKDVASWDITGTDKNGTAYPRKLNDDKADPSLDYIALQKLTVADSSAFVVGGDISSTANAGVGKVHYINGNDIFVKDVVGVFVPAVSLDNAASFGSEETTLTSIVTNSDQVALIYGAYCGSRGNDISVAMCSVKDFNAHTVLTLASDEAQNYELGTLVTGVTSSAKGIVYFVDTTNDKIYVRSVSGTFQAEVVNFSGFTRLTVGAGEVANFAIGETVTGGTSSATGVVYLKDAVNNYIFLKSVSGTFQAEALSGSFGASGTASAFTTTVGTASAFATSSAATYDGSNTFEGQITADYGVTSLASDEIAIIVLVDDVYTESHLVSTDTTAIASGNVSKYIDNWLENESLWIRSVSATSGTVDITDFDGYFQATALTNGASTQPDLTACQNAYDKIFSDKRNDIYLVTDLHDFASYSEANYNTLLAYIQGKADSTKEHYIVSVLPKTAIDEDNFDITDIDTSVVGINSKYVSVYDNWKQIWDKYNRKKIYIPLSGDVSGLMIETFNNYGDFKAPFGNIRGALRNTSVLYHNLTQGDGSQVSSLYQNGINNIIYKDGVGNVVWGNKTRYNAASDLVQIQAVHVLTRDLKTLSKTLDNYISETPEEATFRLIRNACDAGYLAKRSEEGAYNKIDGDAGYLFICDSTNNNGITAKNKEIICDFYIKPALAAEYIRLTAIVTASGVSFSDIVG